ncbi:chitinase [Streptomyces carminius]|uniref:chitinase n=1 Tax=Streptomyces carminius TaxID=2665496 RepID=A0A2M8LW97_9ACTN|nr:glycosyl hydrolase family 18 protein [Streptomyces carminius]PJE96243.1 chitinase [Streptomyces carminius]
MAPTAQAAEEATATYAKVSDWGSGFEGKWTIRNTGDTAIDSWTLNWDFPSGTTVGAFWDADVSGSAGAYTAKNKTWNGTLAPGASVSFGFNGSGSGEPSGCAINGRPCDGSAGPGEPEEPEEPNEPEEPEEPGEPAPPGDQINLGYFIDWGVYQRDYHVKNLLTSGSAAKLTHINYAFGDVKGGKCAMGDAYAATDKAYTAEQSVDGEADTWDQPLRGNFNQLLKLKETYPHIKILWSFGGWTWSGGFPDAMKDPAAFAESCHQLVNDPRWEGLFDGIDLDWEYPNACGLSCDTSGPEVIEDMARAFRDRFGDQLVTAAITADGSSGGKLDQADYAGASKYFDWYNVMTYDYFGAFAPQGPTAPHSPLTSYDGIPKQGFNSAAAIQKLKAEGVPADKLLLGIGFYGRGWTGVTQKEPGGTATGAAPGSYEAGIEDYKVLKSRCPANGTVAGTAYAHCGNEWWSYDTPATVAGKMDYARQQGLGGAFFWEFSGDTSDGELITAIHNGLNR